MGNLIPNQRYSMEFKYTLALRFGFWIETADNDLVTSATMLASLKKSLAKDTFRHKSCYYITFSGYKFI